MDTTSLLEWLPNILNILLALGGLSISWRAFWLYGQVRSSRLFVLALAMGLIALTAGADFARVFVTAIPFHSDWFLYLGQASSFFFIFLSLLRNSERYLRLLILWQSITTGLLLFLLLLALWLPDVPDALTRLALSGSRALVCLAIFSYYTSAFAAKGARFSLLISIAFFLLCVGYILILLQYFFAHQENLDYIGDSIRIIGLFVLMLAYIKG